MSIDLRRFVDINIKGQQVSSVRRTRGTTVLISLSDNGPYKKGYVASATQSDITQYKEYTKQYINYYFASGGSRLHVIEHDKELPYIEQTIKDLPNEEIVIVIASDNSLTGDNSPFAPGIVTEMAQRFQNEYGIKSKLFVCGIRDTSLSDPKNEFQIYVDNYKLDNIIYKYSKSYRSITATVAAYLSKINIESSNSVKDYCYVAENVAAQTSDDEMLGMLMGRNVNVDIQLANAVRNIGGNCGDGSDIVNNYLRIILQQTVTDRLIELLTTNIKGQAGITKICSTIAKELQIYLNCGYLTTDKIWTKDDVFVTYNGQAYPVITKGTALTDGYALTVLPMSSLTEADIAAHKTPPIYLVLAEQYGIRMITINGEVI